jgi:hypothetical protein
MVSYEPAGVTSTQSKLGYRQAEGFAMNNRIIHLLIFGAAFLAACASNIVAAEAPKEDQAIFDKLITAIAKADYDSFVADGVGSFKNMTQDQFDGAVRVLSPQLNSGYEATYLGVIKKNWGHVVLWRLTFKNAEEEALATLSVKDGKVSSFTIK